jgi:hypothetical protein
MYRDFGADDWFFEVDETSGEELWQRLRAVVSQPERARAQVGSIMRTVDGLQKRMVELVRATIGRA